MRWIRKAAIAALAAALATGLAVVAMAAADVGPLPGGGKTPSTPGGLEAEPARGDGRFDRFLGAQESFRDGDGNIITVVIDAGSLVRLSEGQLVVTLNSGEEKAFAVTDKTRIPHREGLEEGDNVIVVSRAGSDEARLVLQGRYLRLLGRLPILLGRYLEVSFDHDRHHHPFRAWRHHRLFPSLP